VHSERDHLGHEDHVWHEYLQRLSNSWGAQWFKVVVERGSAYKGIITAYNDLGNGTSCP
jgi:hypothetical protein